MDELKKFKSFFYEKYKKMGDGSFYKYLFNYCSSKVFAIEKTKYNSIYPHIEMIKYHDMAMKIFRKDKNKDDTLLSLAKIFRQVGHKIYRILLNKNLIDKNDQFLTKVVG